MPANVMVDVLRGVCLVVHQKSTLAQSKVLNQNDVGLRRAIAFSLGDPEPGFALSMQPKRGAVADACCLARPDDAIATDAEIGARCRAGNTDVLRIRPAEPQQESPDPGAKRRPEHLVDHDAASSVLMRDIEDRAVRKHADRKTALVPDMGEAESAVPRSKGNA